MGACFLDMTYQLSYYCYTSYLTSFLRIVYETDVATAGYISNKFSVVIAGWLIRVTGRSTWIVDVRASLYPWVGADDTLPSTGRIYWVHRHV